MIFNKDAKDTGRLCFQQIYLGKQISICKRTMLDPYNIPCTKINLNGLKTCIYTSNCNISRRSHKGKLQSTGFEIFLEYDTKNQAKKKTKIDN